MPKQRIALRTKHFADCLEVCERDATFRNGFSKTRDLFALHAREHEQSRSPDDVSAHDIEAQMLRLYFFVTVGARMQLAAAALNERFITGLDPPAILHVLRTHQAQLSFTMPPPNFKPKAQQRA